MFSTTTRRKAGVVGNVMAGLVLGLLLAAQASDGGEIEKAKEECSKALRELALGRSCKPLMRIPYDWPKLLQLLDSDDIGVKRLVADTLATLALWDRGLGNALNPDLKLRRHLESAEDPQVRAGVVAFVLASTALEADARSQPEARREAEKIQQEAGPAFIELMTGAVPPPHAKALVAFPRLRALAPLLPKEPEARKMLMRRAIHATSVIIADAARLSKADLSPLALPFPTPETEQQLLEENRDFYLRTAVGTLYKLAQADPDVFWPEMLEYVHGTSSADFRRVLATRFLEGDWVKNNVLGPNAIKNLKELMTALADDWDPEVKARAKSSRSTGDGVSQTRTRE